MKPGGDILVTDFHPKAFQAGMKRTFRYDGATFEVEHHVHTFEAIRSIAASLHLEVMRAEEAAIDASVRESFERRKLGDAYRKSVGTLVVSGFRLHRLL